LAAPLSLILGLIAVTSGVVTFISPAGSVERWPGRGMAFLGASLSWMVLAAGILFVLYFLVALTIGGGNVGPNNLP